MLIPLGILASSGGGAAGSFDLISSTILTGSQASVTFDVTGLGATYKHLQIRMVGRMSRADVYDEVDVIFNGDTTASNYKAHILYGDGSSANSVVWGATRALRVADLPAANASSNIFAPLTLDLVDAFGSKNKTTRTFSGMPNLSFISYASGLWMNTSALTSIEIKSAASNFVSGSRFSIYGIKG